MSAFLLWFNDHQEPDPLAKAGLAHLWLVTIHPFDDGNGRIARAVGDMALARAEQAAQRFYSLPAQMQDERKDYFSMLERTQRGTLEVTYWLEWFLGCLLALRDITDLLGRGLLIKLDAGGRSTRYALTPLD